MNPNLQRPTPRKLFPSSLTTNVPKKSFLNGNDSKEVQPANQLPTPKREDTDRLLEEIEGLKRSLHHASQMSRNYASKLNELEVQLEENNKNMETYYKKLLEAEIELVAEKEKNTLLETKIEDLALQNKEEYLQGFSKTNRADLELIKSEKTLSECKSQFEMEKKSLRSQFDMELNQLKYQYEDIIDDLRRENNSLKEAVQIKDQQIEDLKCMNSQIKDQLAQEYQKAQDDLSSAREEIARIQNSQKKRSFSEMEPPSSTLQTLNLENKIRELQHQVDIYRDASKMVPHFKAELEKLILVEAERDQLKMIVERQKAESKMELDTERESQEKDEKNVKIIHFSKTPLMHREDFQKDKIISDLENKIALLENQMSGPDPLNISQINTLQEHQTKIKSLENTIEDMNKASERLKQVVQAKIKEFQNLVEHIFGWKITLEGDKGTIYRLKTIHGMKNDEFLLFKLSSKKVMVMLETAFSKSLPPQITNLLAQQVPIPCFISEVTLLVLVIGDYKNNIFGWIFCLVEMISSISTHDAPLYIAKIRLDQLRACFYALIKQIMFQEEDGKFYSLVKTAEEISIVVEDETLFEFPDYSITILKSSWKALSISFGCNGLYESGIVSSLSTILSKAGIQIIYLSTSITDYILVPSYKIHDAVKVLQEHGKVLNEPLFEFDNLDNMDRYIDSEKTVFSLKQMFEEFSTPSTIQTIPKPPFECNLLPDRLILCSQYTENITLIAHGVLKFLLSNESTFFSISQAESEITLLVNQDFLDYFPQEVVTLTDIWRPIRRFEKKYHNEIGVVASLSSQISSENIPILYISTFSSAYIIVREMDLAILRWRLEASKLTISDHIDKATVPSKKVQAMKTESPLASSQ